MRVRIGAEDLERSPIDHKIAGDIGVSENELSAERLEKWQLAEIRRLISYIKRSRYYRLKLQNVDPESIRSSEDFCDLPVTCESDLSGNENDFLCLGSDAVKRMITVPTTGTTGGNKRLAFTGKDIARAMDFITVAYTTFMHKGDRMIVMMSGGVPGSIGDVVKHSMDQLGAESVTYGPVTDIADAYETVCEYKPDVITGIPVQMAALARYSELKGKSLNVREVLLSADDVPDAICSRLRRVWGARVFRHFGMTELCIAGGCECCADMGYHLRHSDHYFEIIDPDKDGYGELAVTTFHHEAMPLLRYKTGDIARIDRTPCSCGSMLPRLIGPKGRVSNSTDFGRGRIFLRDIEEVIFTESQVIDFECEVIEDSAVQVTLKHLPGDDPDTGRVKRLLQCLQQFEGLEISIHAEETDCFEEVYNSKKRLVRK